VIKIPITPFHMTFAWAFHRLTGKRTVQPALLIGSMVPDIEIPFLVFVGYTYPHTRLVLHSFLGGAILGTLIAIGLLYIVFPFVAAFFTGRAPSEIKNMYNFKNVVISSLIGVVFLHVFIDALHHPYNPLFWPFTPENITLFVIGNYALTTVYIHIISGIPLVIIILYLIIKRDSELWAKWLL